MLQKLLNTMLIATLLVGVSTQLGFSQETNEPTAAEPAATGSVLQQDSDEASPSDVQVNPDQPVTDGDIVQPSANFQAPTGDGFSDPNMNQFVPDSSGVVVGGNGCGNNMTYHAPHVHHAGGCHHSHCCNNCCTPVVRQCCPRRRVRLFTGFRRRCCN